MFQPSFVTMRSAASPSKYYRARSAHIHASGEQSQSSYPCGGCPIRSCRVCEQEGGSPHSSQFMPAPCLHCSQSEPERTCRGLQAFGLCSSIDAKKQACELATGTQSCRISQFGSAGSACYWTVTASSGTLKKGKTLAGFQHDAL